MSADAPKSYTLMFLAIILVALGVSSLGINGKQFRREADFVLGCEVVGVGAVAFIAGFGYRIAYIAATVLGAVGLLGSLADLFYISVSTNNQFLNTGGPLAVALMVINAFIAIICLIVCSMSCDAGCCAPPKDEHILKEYYEESDGDAKLSSNNQGYSMSSSEIAS